jgi:3-deoxy-manno-octulosonate cytidylyltransferase (CMP-KDO synthetase)
VVVAIPARYASTRLPGKPLLTLAGRPMIEHVHRRARAVPGVDRVVVLTDDERIAAAVRGFGGEVELTPEDCASGTDRIAWALRQWPETGETVVINVQGDEPLIDPAAIRRVADHLRRHPEDPVATLAAPMAEGEGQDPNAVKVVVSVQGYALYFSRAAIPYLRTGGIAGAAPRKHIGIYGYQRAALLRLAALEPTPLERAEGLEQLRALENGIPIRVLTADRPSPGVDTAADLKRVEAILTASDLTASENPRFAE